MIEAQYVSTINEGAYVFNFSIQYMDNDGEWKTTTWNSGNYPVGQDCKTPSLDTVGVPEGAICTVYGHAILGSSGTADKAFKFIKNGNTVSYKAVGTTFIGFGIKQIG